MKNATEQRRKLVTEIILRCAVTESHANYFISCFNDLVSDPKKAIDFDTGELISEREAKERVARSGSVFYARHLLEAVRLMSGTLKGRASNEAKKITDQITESNHAMPVRDKKAFEREINE